MRYLFRCLCTGTMTLVVITTLWNGQFIYSKYKERRGFHHVPVKTSNDLTTSEKNNILVLTYTRSGSTFTADLIQQAPDVFYVYEPLKPVAIDGYFRSNLFCSSDTGLCRKAENKTEDPAYILNVIDHFYNCDLDKVPQFFFRPSARKSDTFKMFKNCTRVEKNMTACLAMLKDRCHGSSKMIKSVRMSMDFAKSLMIRVPSLKIIYLIRDPRARYFSEFCVSMLNFISESKIFLSFKRIEAQCKDMDVDLKTYIVLKNSKFKDRIRMYIYEDLANEPFKYAKDIYTFLRLHYTNDVEKWLSKHVSNDEDNGKFQTTRENSSYTALKWRKIANNRLSFLYEKVNEVCENMMNVIGYTKFKNLNEIKNLSIPVLQRHSNQRIM